MSLTYPWLDPYRQSFAAVFRQGRLPHALLLTGRPGTGKGILAEYIARLLLCEQPTEDFSPCGRCQPCTLFRSGTHPDYHFVSFEPDEKTGKLRKSIIVEQIRTLSGRLSLKSHAGGSKVAIITPADALNINASNSLLKTLEEPSDNTVLILVSAKPGLLAPTLRSRCQQFPIEVQDTGPVLAWLSGQLDMQEPGVYLQLAGNAPLEALRLARQDAIGERSKYFSDLADILDGRASPLTVAQAWSADEDMQAIRWLRDWLMDLLRIRMTGRMDDVVGRDVADRLQALAGRLDSRILFEQLDRINRALQMAASGLNRQLMTEDILLAWAGQG